MKFYFPLFIAMAPHLATPIATSSIRGAGKDRSQSVRDAAEGRGSTASSRNLTYTGNLLDLRIENLLGSGLILKEVWLDNTPAASLMVETDDSSGNFHDYFTKSGVNNITAVLDQPTLEFPNGGSMWIKSIATTDVVHATFLPQNLTYQQNTALQAVVVTALYDATAKDFVIAAQFVHGTYSADFVQRIAPQKTTGKCMFNGGNTTVYFNAFECNSASTPFICPQKQVSDVDNQQMYSYCLPPVNDTSIGFEGIVSKLNWGSSTPYAIVALTEVMYRQGYAGWKAVASFGSQETMMSTSWSQGSSTTQNATHALTFSESMSSEVKFGEPPFATATVDTSASASQYIAWSTSQTISSTQSGKSTIICNPAPCDGILYQWNVAASDLYGNQANVYSCDFQCVPFLQSLPPQCPQGYCSSASCNCCNGIWRGDTSDPVANVLDKRLGLGGNCTPFELNTVALN